MSSTFAKGNINIVLIFSPTGPFNPQVIINSAISNIVACLVLGQRFDYHDERYQNILRLDTECVQLAGLTRTQVQIRNGILRKKHF